MSTWTSQVINRQDSGTNKYILAVHTYEIEGRKLRADAYMYYTGTSTPYYQYNTSGELACGNNRTGISNVPWTDIWESGTWTIGGLTCKKRCLLAVCDSQVASVTGESIGVSLSYSTPNASRNFLPVVGTYTAGGTDYISPEQVWNNINAYYPDGTSEYGLTFDVWIDGNHHWENCNNEPWSTSDRFSRGANCRVYNIKPGNETYYVYSGNNWTWNRSTDVTWQFQQDNYAFCLYTNYKINYDASGGTGAPGYQEKQHNVNLTLSNTRPTKADTTRTGYTVVFDANGGDIPQEEEVQVMTDTTHYTFSHWVSEYGVNYSPGGIYDRNSGDVLSAAWNSQEVKGSVQTPTPTRNNGISRRVVTFNPNGGTCEYDKLNSDATITYTALGWYTYPGGVKQCDNGDIYTPVQNWDILSQHWDQTIGPYSAILLPIPTRRGYIFCGWAESPDASGGVTGEYIPEKSLTLYAIWEFDQATAYINTDQGYTMGRVWYKKDSGLWVAAKRIYRKDENEIWRPNQLK